MNNYGSSTAFGHAVHRKPLPKPPSFPRKIISWNHLLARDYDISSPKRTPKRMMYTEYVQTSFVLGFLGSGLHQAITSLEGIVEKYSTSSSDSAFLVGAVFIQNSLRNGDCHVRNHSNTNDTEFTTETNR